MAAIDKFREMFKAVTKKESDPWLERIPADTGNSSGVVQTGTFGMIWVRTTDGQELEVFNSVVEEKYNLKVYVGRLKDSPDLWRVIGTREVWGATPGSSAMRYHHEQHEYPNIDTVWVNRKQILTLDVLVSNAAGFIVQVYGGIIRTGNTYVEVTNQLFDLSSYAPSYGAVFVNIEADITGTLTAKVGTNFGAPVLASATLIPIPVEGHFLIASVRLYESQTALSNDDILIPFPIERGGMGAQIYSAIQDNGIHMSDLLGYYQSSTGLFRSVSVLALKNKLSKYAEQLHAVALNALQALRAEIYEQLRRYIKGTDTPGGDLSGTYATPIISSIRSLPVDPALSPGVGDSLIWDGSQLTSGSGSGFILTLEEVDGSPSVPNVTTIKVTNGSLTNLGSGVVQISTGGSGGGADPVLAIMDLLGWA